MEDALLELTAGACRLLVDAADGGRITSLQVGDFELLGRSVGNGTPAAFDHGSFPMAPWAGRIRGGRFTFRGAEYRLPANFGAHAIHGVTFDQPWVRVGDDRIGCELSEPWPFGGSAEQHFVLSPDELRVTLSVRAASRPMPVVLGLHPWFPRELKGSGPARIEFSPTAQYLRDAEGIPTGETVAPTAGPWDDCFVAPSRQAAISWPGSLDLIIASDHDHFVVFDQLPDAFCIEPQTGPPDAVNLGSTDVLEPYQTLALTVSLRWSQTPARD